MPDRIRLLMQHFGLPQRGLAALIGVNPSQVSFWISGKSSMPQSTAMAFQAALGVRWQWLLNGDGEMLFQDMGKLSEEEVRLLSTFRQSDIEARAAILEQAEFQLGRADRRRVPYWKNPELFSLPSLIYSCGYPIGRPQNATQGKLCRLRRG